MKKHILVALIVAAALGVVELAGHVRRRFLELFDALAETLGEFRDALGAKEHENRDQHDNQFRPAQP